jgi:aspartyl-tRNA synthetase
MDYTFFRRVLASAQCTGLEGARKLHFLWVTEFPLFTRADSDKEFLAHGRWSSSHHPFTAPMLEDVERLTERDFAAVSCSLFRCFASINSPKGPWSAL